MKLKNTLLIALLAVICSANSLATQAKVCMPNDMDAVKPSKHDRTVRFATFNAFLNRNTAGQLITDLQDTSNSQISAVAEIIQRTRPDVLLLNEFDFDENGEAIALFQDNFLSLPQNGQKPIHYPHIYLAPSNTGIPSGLDFDNDGSTSGPGDAFGFGFFPGQFAMVLLSRYPIADRKVRTFQKFLWKDMPGALLPDDAETTEPNDYYSKEELAEFRLSSKSHWDIPIYINKRIVHILAAHPTPPVFDGPEDRNGKRNHDEIRFWADYVKGRYSSRYIVDDHGRRGGLNRWSRFVILGDYNADPNDGDSTNNAITQLLKNPTIDASIAPASLGGFEDAENEGQLNDIHLGNAALDTADFNPANPGNLRVDYVLPSKFGLSPVCGGIFWPTTKDESRYLVGDGFPVVSSDHHLVWLDIIVR